MKRLLILLTIFALLIVPLFAFAQVEQVLSYVVTDEATMVDSLDTWFASKDSDFGQYAFLVSTIANGSDPTTHYLVLIYPDYTSYQAALDGVIKSGEFSKLESRISKIATLNSESLYTQVLSNGKPEKAGDFIYTMNVNVTGSGLEYAAACKELMNSEIGKKAPGIFKVNAGLSGTDSSHLGILSAPSFAALNEYRDSYTGNKDWANFLSKAEKISTLTGSGFLRVVKVWK